MSFKVGESFGIGIGSKFEVGLVLLLDIYILKRLDCEYKDMCFVFKKLNDIVIEGVYDIWGIFGCKIIFVVCVMLLEICYK